MLLWSVMQGASGSEPPLSCIRESAFAISLVSLSHSQFMAIPTYSVYTSLCLAADW
jgi:hypothetical protein